MEQKKLLSYAVICSNLNSIVTSYSPPPVVLTVRPRTLRDINLFVQSETQQNALFRVLFAKNLHLRNLSLDKRLSGLLKQFEVVITASIFLAHGLIVYSSAKCQEGPYVRCRISRCYWPGNLSWCRTLSPFFGAMCRCWVVTDPYSSSLVGPFAVVGSRSGLTHRRWNVARPYSFSLGLVVVSVLLFVVGSSFPDSGVIRVTMVRVGWSCLLRYASVGRNVGVERVLSEARKKGKNDENEPQLWSWFALVTY